MNVIENIKSKYVMFTSRQKCIADYLIQKPADICYISIAELSKRTGCSAVTILNFCKKIGFDNFVRLKDEFRNYNQNLVNEFSGDSYQIPPELSDKAGSIPFLENVCQEELNKITTFYGNLNISKILDAATLITRKKIIYIFAHDASRNIASFLQTRLDVLNINYALVDLSDMHQVEYVIRQITPADAAILFSFPNYYYAVASVAENIRQKDCPLILLTNSSECPAYEYAQHVLLCETQNKIFHNSWVTPMIMLNLLTSFLAILQKDE